MRAQFCTYEISLKLKKLGFNEECFGFFESKTSVIYPFMNHNEKNAISAPLWQQCLDWLREKYGLYVYFKPDKPNNIGDVEFVIEKHWPDKVICREICMTYEHAREDGILKALTLIK